MAFPHIIYVEMQCIVGGCVGFYASLVNEAAAGLIKW